MRIEFLGANINLLATINDKLESNSTKIGSFFKVSNFGNIIIMSLMDLVVSEWVLSNMHRSRVGVSILRYGSKLAKVLY